ncbi:MAG TPA: heparan-alpha-glucosaminide N-acetyltransferase domain-containing protein [Gemmatimonadaceae bacterium]|nr:heparan-alpha-glucosaminide N-acetyltransferase domain-containing protein [Gemmatimonadaceae bacterium]
MNSVDLLRGIVMVIMLLDHTRDFVHADTFRFDATDITRTWPALFLTRWITHFCAPIFVFLAGTGVYLQLLRGKPKKELTRFLVTRGLWLIVLEFTLVRLGVFFTLDYQNVLGFMQVIWVIGVSMIVLAGLIYLPLRTIAWLGIGMILTHNILDDFRVDGWRGPGTPIPGFGATLWLILHQGGLFFPFGFPGPGLIVLYPLIPWIGVMAAGYVFGSVYADPPVERRRWLLRTGTALTFGFIVLRAVNFYGDPDHWSLQDSAVMTVLSFLDTTKYPPSLLFLLMTLGPALIFLGLFDDARESNLARPLITFGRVPMFFYLLQWPVAHGFGILASMAVGKPYAHLIGSPLGNAPPGPEAGFNLATVYLFWILGTLLLYPLCRWYAKLKATGRYRWLSYL